jgi:hypothetical protein
MYAERVQSGMTQSVRLDAKALAKAWAVFWSGLVVFVGITSRFGWGTRWEALFEDIYPGYNQSASGLVVGGAFAFLDGIVDAYIVARLYNRFAADPES